MQLPDPRGELSSHVIDLLAADPSSWRGSAPSPEVDEPLTDDDLQLALACCYELHYLGFDGVDDSWEWDSRLLGFRAGLEEVMTRGLMDAVGAPNRACDVPTQLRELVAADSGPSLSTHLAHAGSLEQFCEFVMHRSAYQLKEADPHTWAIPRLRGLAKATLVGIQQEEYGEGELHRMHSTLFAELMSALGLDCTYGAYIDALPGVTLATVNLMSLFGLHRRWRGAIVGHLAVFEITSPVPNKRYADGLRRLGLEASATRFYDEHVQADAVHERMATEDLAGALAVEEPSISGDILFGARCLIHTDNSFAAHLLGSWSDGRSSLLQPRSGALAL